MPDYAAWNQQPQPQPQPQPQGQPLQQPYQPQGQPQPQQQPQPQPQPHQSYQQSQGQPYQPYQPQQPQGNAQSQPPAWLKGIQTPVMEMPRSGLPLCRALWFIQKAELMLNKNSAVVFRAELLLKHVFSWNSPNDPMANDPRLGEKPFFAYLNLSRRGGEPIRHFSELLCHKVAQGLGLQIDFNTIDIERATGCQRAELESMTPATDAGSGRTAICYAFMQREFVCSTKAERSDGGTRTVMDWESIAQQQQAQQMQQPVMHMQQPSQVPYQAPQPLHQQTSQAIPFVPNPQQ